ncbi:MarC family protein [Desulfoplanes sp. PS50]|jgi:multiple antibiotic resistance protein
MFISLFIKLFFLLTPFFVLTMFLSLTREMGRHEKQRMAVRVTCAVLCTTFVIFFLGNSIFDIFGITLDAFRIGAGSLLFLSAVELVHGKAGKKPEHNASDGDMSVVPLAIPITVGPATVGALLVMGAGQRQLMETVIGSLALTAAVVSVGILLLMAAHIERLIGKTGIIILSKLTGLILSALAAQIVFTGISNFLT